jgi:hypothetical protein
VRASRAGRTWRGGMYSVYKARYMSRDGAWIKYDVTNKAAAIKSLKRLIASGEATSAVLVADPKTDPMTGEIVGGTIVFQHGGIAP